ncbi:MAG: endopeptidase La [Desulfatibacillaceae bacterium]
MGNTPYQKDVPQELPEIIPIIPVMDVALFPKMQLPLMVTQKELVQLVDEALAKDRVVGVLATKSKTDETVLDPKDVYHVGTAALIVKMAKAGDDKAQMLAQGLGRFRVVEFIEGKPYMQARIEKLEDQHADDTETEALVSNLIDLYTKLVELAPYLPTEIVEWVKTLQDPGSLADVVASTIQTSLEDKQLVLETVDVKQRLQEVTRIANHQLEVLELGQKIQSQVKEGIDKKQREYYLREQIRAMKEELGEAEDENVVELEEFRRKIDELDLEEEARKEAERELDRLARMHPSSSEYTVATTYLDWFTSLPWNTSTEDNLDTKLAMKILDEDHYDLEKPKRRIVETLAVRKLNPGGKAPILCFVGPPGTGKTSLGRSIARAMGREFVRISLGGVRDEAEIRGHRRTYVGAMPGRIIQGIRRCGSNNPVFMLDEVDKVGSDFRGDPASALLEVLDPQQNYSFRDHYLDVPFDLSRVMFITTANILDTIPPALRDRMEILTLSGYTQEEKIKIAKRYLIPRQREQNGLSASQVRITDGALKNVISGYTREAGLRNLEREIGTLCRGAARKIVDGEVETVGVGQKDLHEYLGPWRFQSETAERTETPGVAMGLAWTQTGGDLLFIEATAMHGNKGLTLTGQLGDVMKESAQAALSFVRANADKLGVDPEWFEKKEIHVHVPAGAIPKDGPSAGVTILTTITSLVTGVPLKKDIAMTGEITLRGKVLPVGGIKDKVLAAYRAGVKEVILPKWNEKDIEDVPDNVKENITFHFVDKMEDVIRIALPKAKKGRRKKS